MFVVLPFLLISVTSRSGDEPVKREQSFNTKKLPTSKLPTSKSPQTFFTSFFYFEGIRLTLRCSLFTNLMHSLLSLTALLISYCLLLCWSLKYSELSDPQKQIIWLTQMETFSTIQRLCTCEYSWVVLNRFSATSFGLKLLWNKQPSGYLYTKYYSSALFHWKLVGYLCLRWSG